jgi:hypothetical protein
VNTLRLDKNAGLASRDAAVTTDLTDRSFPPASYGKDALSVAAPANPPTRQTERLSPHQMRVCDLRHARHGIRHRAFAPLDFGFTACILACGGRELVHFWCVKRATLGHEAPPSTARRLVPDPELIRRRATLTRRRHGSLRVLLEEPSAARAFHPPRLEGGAVAVWRNCDTLPTGVGHLTLEDAHASQPAKEDA